MISQGAMWSNVVILPSPAFDQDLGFWQGMEDLTVQELISHFAIERLDVAIFLGAARLNEERLPLQPLQPISQQLGNEFGSVVRTSVHGHSTSTKQLRDWISFWVPGQRLWQHGNLQIHGCLTAKLEF